MKTRWEEAATFPRLRRGSLVQQIAGHLRRRIVTGDLPVEGRLPPIPRLAALYGVSRPTVHAAIHAVEALGLVRVRHGVGVFVSRPRSSAAVLSHAWMQATPRELAFMRFAMETQAALAAAAIVQRTDPERLPPSLRDLRFLAAERATARHAWPEHHVAADMAFHRAVLSAVPGAAMLTSLHRSLEQQLATRLISLADAHRSDPWLDDAHTRLAEAILDGRSGTAARLARTIGRRELIPPDDPLG